MKYTRQIYKTRLFKNMITGQDVLAVQVKLAGLGYYNGTLDGEFWKITDKAVKAYQKAKGLKIDGIVGKITWGSLFGAEEVSEQAKKFISLAAEQVKNGSIYVLGAQGQTNNQITEAWIKMRTHNDKTNYTNAINLWKARIAAGFANVLRAFDCSGLAMWILEQLGVKVSDHNAAGLYSEMCNKIDRTELKAGDLVFKHNGIKVHHVGIYMGDGTIVEAKGHAYGVVRTAFNTSWNRYGRFKSKYLA
ncbi:MAG TPA: peptidoglycan-binding protein [Candidatus Omnitrophota bacterium]|nr:peptidoglycan-binding protein [Candidatus Omnitrophota bacterium]